ncbi:polysaccharide biosynthesis protein [Algibacter amylolyticus]|uniref:Polysaccharide biosynthesis protein n=1 Tax=Algibacter amylolyticus TaxID=1608400 RepID=A0A5M7BDS5_9FLAO|nr:nucleoside-diphosphate sugar epimerase/dehydratase [Algibacter amylolyticus]KAA5825581.1 polysaccharide biosynthesis protein [Algibacter amylolyticus]MBB5268193.1 FlaA1/EpsC-like NDP-sugar epimerase [Algibacter amylolyticus]TSJ79879.1 polysaccharide biosynthesis protein [Algibacter amylolyticus]
MINNYFINFSQKYASKWLVFTIDLVLILVAFFAAYVIRFNFTLNFDVNQFLVEIPFLMVVSALSIFIVGSFKSVIRHTGFTDVVNVFKSVALMSLLCIAFVLTNRITDIIPGFTIPLSIIVIHALLSFVILSASRLAFKMGYKYLKCKFLSTRRVLIYGTGDSAMATYNALLSNAAVSFTVVAFINNQPKKNSKIINGVPILTYKALNEDYVLDNDIDEIIITPQNTETNKLMQLMDSLADSGVKVTKVPPIEQWINGELSAKQIKQVQIDDLLGRPPIEIDNPNLLSEFNGETVLVTGAAGSIGSELVKQLSNFNVKHLILVDQAESALYDVQQDLKREGKHSYTAIVADIRDGLRIDSIFQKHKPTMVFHAAAYKHVPLMENSPYEAIKINVNGTKLLADTASRYNVKKFVFVSTDKAVNPTSVMGATKRMAEMYISCLQKESKTKFITTRFGNVLGSNGSVIPLFKKQIEAGSSLTLTHKDITRYFMTIPEAAQLVLEAGTMGKGGEIFIFDMGESVKIYDLAKNMIKLSGLRYPEDIDIKITGLRPGEKLYEELLANGENTLSTYHKKILISKTRELDYIKVKSEIEELCITNRFQNNNIVMKMKSLIPEYKSNNSEYERFDTRVKTYKKAKGLSDNSNSSKKHSI